MKWTGHSDYKAMKPYIDIVDSIKASSMTKFDGLIKKWNPFYFNKLSLLLLRFHAV